MCPYLVLRLELDIELHSTHLPIVFWLYGTSHNRRQLLHHYQQALRIVQTIPEVWYKCLYAGSFPLSSFQPFLYCNGSSGIIMCLMEFLEKVLTPKALIFEKSFLVKLFNNLPHCPFSSFHLTSICCFFICLYFVFGCTFKKTIFQLPLFLVIF